MKYVIVIPDGCADEPQESLGGKTPLQAANKPPMDRTAQLGGGGRSKSGPASLTPASDVATLSLFGYDPLVVYTGRAPLEAAAFGVTLGPGDWAVRCNLVHVPDGHMRDFTSGHITSEEGRQIIATLAQVLQAADISTPDGLTGPPPALELYPGVGYRNLLVVRNGDALLGDDLKTQPPHDIPDKPVADYLPKGKG